MLFTSSPGFKVIVGRVNCNTVTAILLCSFQWMLNKRDFRFSQRYCWRFKCWWEVTPCNWVSAEWSQVSVLQTVPHVMTRTAISEVTRYGHIFSIRVSITVLIWTRLIHGLSHRCPSYPAIMQRTVHQHIVLSQLDNTLPTERTRDGHGVSSSKSRP
jgi:hypothetical protein